ncbi:hypothetical protein DNTS_016128, partial [Danionella cerebrum]
REWNGPALFILFFLCPVRSIMALEGGGRSCGVHELICARRVETPSSNLPPFEGFSEALQDGRCPEKGSSESEEELPKRQNDRQQKRSGWRNRDGGNEDCSSEASAEIVQKKKGSGSLNELQPPPYRDKEDLKGGSRGHCDTADGSGSEMSEGSQEPGDTESYLNKGYEEDAPSDSTAVLGPELFIKLHFIDSCMSYITAGFKNEEQGDHGFSGWTWLLSGHNGCSAQGTTTIRYDLDSLIPPLPETYEPEAQGKYGTLDVAFEYDSEEQRLAVTVTAATDIPTLKTTGNISWQVHLVLLPTKKQRAKTGSRRARVPSSPKHSGFHAWSRTPWGTTHVRRMKKEKVLGEKGCGSVVSVSRSAGALSYHSTGESSTPELLLGLLYNSTTGRLSAEVIKGSHFKNAATDKLPHTYVKLTMLDSKGKEMTRCKTSFCRGQPNPTYKETFIFQVALFQLSEVTLQVSVYSRRSSMKRRQRVGWVALGLNSTTEEQEEHWSKMKESEGQQNRLFLFFGGVVVEAICGLSSYLHAHVRTDAKPPSQTGRMVQRDDQAFVRIATRGQCSYHREAFVEKHLTQPLCPATKKCSQLADPGEAERNATEPVEDAE